MTPLRRLLGLVLALATTSSSAARADERDECAAAYEQSQRAERKAELVSALDSAERCARTTCPGLLRDECAQWVTTIRSKQPHLVVRVIGADGCPRENARIEVSGGSKVEADDIVVDPGPHTIKVFDPASSRSKTQKISFAPGERRDIDVDFGAPGAVCGGAEKSSTITPVTLGLGASGAGLFVVGVTLGIIGAAKRGGLDDCRPNCSQDRLDGVDAFFIAGDVVGGLGLALLGAAAITHFLGVGRPTTR